MAQASQPGETIVVVPCYNEAARLDVETFRSYAASASGVRFLFVNDGSTDGTAAVLESLRESDPEVFDVLDLQANGGKAEAVRAGVLEGLERGPWAIGFWDADLSTPLDEIAGFREVLASQPQIEMVFGARVNLLGRSVRRKLYRHYIGRVFATIMATTLRLPIYDTQCGAKLFRVHDGLRPLFEDPFLSRWMFDVEILARLITTRSTDQPAAIDVIYEQPLMRWFDVDGSKIRPRDFWVVSRDYLRIWNRYLRGARA